MQDSIDSQECATGTVTAWEHLDYELNLDWFTNNDADVFDDYYVVSRAERTGIMHREERLRSGSGTRPCNQQEENRSKSRQVLKAIRKGLMTNRFSFRGFGDDETVRTSGGDSILPTPAAHLWQKKPNQSRDRPQGHSSESCHAREQSGVNYKANMINHTGPSLTLDDVSEQAIKQRISRQFSSNITSATESGAAPCSVDKSYHRADLHRYECSRGLRDAFGRH
jgi:hypothetical protein